MSVCAVALGRHRGSVQGAGGLAPGRSVRPWAVRRSRDERSEQHEEGGGTGMARRTSVRPAGILTEPECRVGVVAEGMTEAAGSTHDVATVERVIAAPAATIFALLAIHPPYEIDGSAPSCREEASQTLVLGEVRHVDEDGYRYSMENTVVEFEQDRLIAWQPRPSNPVMCFVGAASALNWCPGGGTLVAGWDTPRRCR
jgi:hypothetical protein